MLRGASLQEGAVADREFDLMLKREVASIACVASLLVACLISTGQAQVAPGQAQGGRIEALLKDGWEVAGYVSAWENRSLILLRHKSHDYLVQCSILIDVTRNPRQVITCYELR